MIYTLIYSRTTSYLNFFIVHLLFFIDFHLVQGLFSYFTQLEILVRFLISAAFFSCYNLSVNGAVLIKREHQFETQCLLEDIRYESFLRIQKSAKKLPKHRETPICKTSSKLINCIILIERITNCYIKLNLCLFLSQ